MGAAVAYGIEKSSESRLPPVNGTLSLPCLDKEGTIKYDSWGVPHIYAQTRKDGYRLQGFITAQHRCFQLVQTYLAMHGQLSSVLGASAKPIDIFSRTCNFTQLGKRDWEFITNHKETYQPAIDMISCYVEGINAWFSHPLFEKPIELSALILNQDPQFWTESDVMSVGRLLGIKMSPGWGSKMLSTLLIQIVGYKNAEWFCFDTEKVYNCPYQDIPNKVGDFYLKLKDIGKLLEKQNRPVAVMGVQHSYFKNKEKYVSPYQPIQNDEKVEVEKVEVEATVMDLQDGGASNGFVVGGKFTDTGKPILCNDPHLTLNIPNTFFHCHLTVECDENKEEYLHWTGVQAVGMPAICIGHTQHVASGITVGSCDTTDIFVERFKDEKSNEYQVDGKWKECAVREEVIKIKGEADYVFTVMETHHGPILTPTDFVPGLEKGPYSHLADTNNNTQCQAENEEYFLRYSFCAAFLKSRPDITNTGVEMFPFILDSKNILEASSHIKKIGFPCLNFMLADTDGNYGWTTNGLIPIRKHMDTYNPQLPQPGWLSQYDWNGYIPMEELPMCINPQRGYVVSCNNNMVDPEKYPYYLGFRFAMGFRAKRASQLIDKQLINHKKITVEYMSSIQTDVYDLSAEEMIENVLNKLDLFTLIDKHEIKLENQKWVQLTMNSVIPKEIRNNIQVDIGYYNDKTNREKAKYAWKMLNEWNFEYTQDSIAATIYDTFLLVLMRRIMMTGVYRGYSDPSQRGFEEEKELKINDISEQELIKIAEKLSQNILRNAYNQVYGNLTSFFYQRFGPAITMLSCENANEECWWITNCGNKENILIMTLIDSMDCIQFWCQTEDKNKWKWGSLHEIEVAHPISAKLGPKPFNSETYGIGGSNHTLNMCRPNCDGIIENPLKVKRSGAPVWRQVIDCSDWSKSKCVLPLGTSGQVASPYYQNQLKLLVDSQYIPMLWNKKDVENNMSSQLKCDPLRNIDDDKSNCQIL